MATPDSHGVLSSGREALRAIGSVVLPGPDALDSEGWARAEAIMEGALRARPPVVRRQVRLFLRVANLLPVLTTGRTLTNLSIPRRQAFLHRLQRSRVLLLRRGLWGIRTLIFMGYYNQDAVRASIGYRVSPDGWEAQEGEQP